jgi:eukaryotic-like serine/threonine-protein kinase
LIASVIGLSIGAVLINRERSKAESNFRRGRSAVDEYFTTISESKLLDVPGLQPLRKELLESAQRYYQDFLRDRGEDRSVRAEAAAALFRVAQVTGLIARAEDAVRIYRQAIALYRDLVLAQPQNMNYRNALAFCRSSLGLLLDGLERDDEGMVELRGALDLRDSLARDHPTNAQFQADVARSHRHVGDIHRQVGEYGLAEEHWQKARMIQESVLRNPPEKDTTPHHLTRRRDAVTVVREDLADILLDLSGLFRERGRWDESLATGRQGRELLEAMVGERPDDVELRVQLAGGYTNLALTTLNASRPAESVELSTRAIAVLENVVAANPSVSNYQGRLADAHLTAGFALERLGRYTEAATNYHRTTELAEILLAAEPSAVYSKSLVAQGLLYESRVLIQEGKLEAGLPLLRRAQFLQEAIVRDYPKVVFYSFNLAFVCRALGRAEERVGSQVLSLAAFDRARQLDESQASQLFIARYNQACDLALMARVAPMGRRESLVDQALSTFKRAIVQGYRSYVELRDDEDLSAVRGHQDFQLLLLDLTFPADPFVPGN